MVEILNPKFKLHVNFFRGRKFNISNPKIQVACVLSTVQYLQTENTSTVNISVVLCLFSNVDILIFSFAFFGNEEKSHN